MKTIRIFLLVVICIIFILGLLYFLSGSFEMFPTHEQQEKARIVSVIMMVIPVICCIILFFTKKN